MSIENRKNNIRKAAPHRNTVLLFLQMLFCELARGPGHVAAGEHMEMQMRHALPCLLTDIGHHTVALNILFLRHPGNHLKNVRNDGAVAPVNAGNRGNVLLRDHKKMHRCLWVNVVECVADLVFIDLAARDLTGSDGAEQTIVFHREHSFQINRFLSGSYA